MVIPEITKVQETFKDYNNLTFVDKGGFKIVYSGMLAEKKEAIKLVFMPSVNDVNGPDEIKSDIIEEAQKRIIREIKLLENANSPFIVKLGELKPRDIYIDNNLFVSYSEEFIDGKNLHKLIREAYLPDEAELKNLLICLLEAVKCLWENSKAIHRDIKPLNVIKTNLLDRPFILLDLGIAYIINETPLTVSPDKRLPPGTTKYLAPEMLNPNFRGNIDFRSDLYTIGITIYEFATGRHPLAKDSDDLLLTLSRIIRGKPEPLKKFRTDLTEDFCMIVDQLMKKIVAIRPSNISKLIDKIKGLK